MKLQIQYITNTGLARDHNEDSVLVDDNLVSSISMEKADEITLEKDKVLCAVADGMGGHSKGEVASKFILAKLKNGIDDLIDRDILKKKLYSIKEDLDIFAEKNPTYLNMGTVIAGVLIVDEKLIVFNVGDCRVYENNFGYSSQLTKDHSFVYSLYESGEIDYDEIKNHPKKNVVTSAFIANKNQKLVDIFIKEVDLPLQSKEWLLCSDGIWESVGITDIDKCFESDSVMECLKTKAMESGANDNFSGIYIKVIE